MTFWERYRQTFNKRGAHGWCIVMGYPVGRLLVVLLLPLRWLSADHYTLFGFACKLGAAWLLAGGGALRLALGIVALQLGTIMDCMDGTLARLRGVYSPVGAFLDKVTDAVGLFALGAAIGLRAFQQTGEPLWIVLGCAGGGGYVTLCYMHWVVWVVTKRKSEAADIMGTAEIPSWGAIFREWLRGWPRVFMMNEGDLYFWIALGALLDRWTWLAVLFGGTQAGGALARIVTHSMKLRRLAR